MTKAATDDLKDCQCRRAMWKQTTDLSISNKIRKMKVGEKEHPRNSLLLNLYLKIKIKTKVY